MKRKPSKQLKMKLQDAIEHLNDTLRDNNRKWCNDDCKNEHIQLRDWLIELQERRLKDENQTAWKVFIMCKLDTAINTTGGTAIACGGSLSIDYFTHFLSDKASIVGIVGLLLSVAFNFFIIEIKV